MPLPYPASPPDVNWIVQMAADRSIACYLRSENSGRLESLIQNPKFKIQNRVISMRRGLLENHEKEHGHKDEEYR